jgi:hypothetical protein
MQIQRSGRMGDTFSGEVSKKIQKEAELPHVEQRLSDDRDDKKQDPQQGTTEAEMSSGDKANRQGPDGAQQLTEKSLREHETKAANADLQGTTEKRLNDASQSPYPHRNPEAHERTGDKRPVNALDEEMGKAGDAAGSKRYEDASSKVQGDTKRILDKDVGKQLTLEHPKKSFNMRKAKVGEMTAACLGYLAYKDSKAERWDKYASVRGLDTELGAIMSAIEIRPLTKAELAKIEELKARKAEMLGVTLAVAQDGVRLAQPERRAASAAIHEATKTQYWPNLTDPFVSISEALNPLGVTIVDSMLTGDDTRGGKGGKVFDLSKNGQPVANAALHVTWHRMESGNWEVVAYLT